MRLKKSGEKGMYLCRHDKERAINENRRGMSYIILTQNHADKTNRGIVGG